MSSEMFETLEEELQSVLDVVDKRIDTRLMGSAYGESRKKVVNEIERDLSEAQSLLQQLESEARLAPQPYRLELTSKIRGHRENVGRTNARYRNVLADFSSNGR